MKKVFRSIASLFRKESTKKENQLSDFVTDLTGKRPKNISLYLLAVSHTSLSKEKEQMIRQSNERLEFLGDAVLGAVIAEYLFKRFPFKDEGFLTEVRSRIVNGENLNALSKKVGLSKMIAYNSNARGTFTHKSMYGDALEALVGAIFLDRGFKFCKEFILNRLLSFVDVEEIVQVDTNYKSRLINWGQSHNKKVIFTIVQEKDHRQFKEFTAQVSIDDETITTAVGLSKKKAEQEAARRAIDKLQVPNSEN